MNHNFIDLIGQQFGRLTVIGHSENNKSGQSRWSCLCECGKETEVLGGHLRAGKIKSCGCFRYKGKNKRENGLYIRICCDCNKIDKLKYSSKCPRCRSCAEKYKYKNKRHYGLIVKTQEEISDIIELYKVDISLVEIGKKHNTTSRTITRILKENYPDYKPRMNTFNKMHESIRKKCETGEWQKMVSGKAQKISIDKWKGFITKEQDFYHKDRWKKFRNKIFLRDNYTCQWCGKRGKEINAHHIKKRSDFKKLSFDYRNILTLCIDCHNKTKFKEKLYEHIFQDMINQIYPNILRISPTYFSV